MNDGRNAVRCAACGAQLRAGARFCDACGTRIVSDSPHAEYKQVTVLFADVVGSMRIAATVGAERWREVMAELVNRASTVVHRYGGSLRQFTGDGIMAVFGAPLALEDHAFRACLAAVATQKEAKQLGDEVAHRDGIDLLLRIGLNSGQVVAGEIGSATLGYTAIGEQVGMAQRMESVAPAGGVMVSESTARLVANSVLLGEREMLSIKGSDEPVPARRLLDVGRTVRIGGWESTLVGRTAELRSLADALQRAADGHGCVIGVGGSAGLGKSRLVHELTTIAADHNIDVFSAQSESHTGEVPFHVITTLLRAATGITGLDGAVARAKLRDQAQGAQPDDLALLDDLLGIGDPAVSSPIIEPDERRRRLTTLINAAVVARNSPAVYVIEDVHWIDEASESMLADFLAVVPLAHALVLITYRPEYPGTLGRPPSSQAISLEPLDDVEIEILTAELLGAHPSVARLAVDIAHHAAGNPYFAQETVRELAERGALTGGAGKYSCRAPIGVLGVPATLQATIASRIDRLEPTAKRALGAASVIGSRFDRELLTLLDVHPAVDELVESELIHPVSFPPQVQYSFRHPLIRTVAYESQLKSDRADMHRRVAEAIEARGTPNEDAALIAEHHEASGDLTAAYTWHVRAGTWSRNRDDHAAQMSWRRAERISRAAFERSGDVRAAELLSRALIGQGRPAEAEEILSRFDPDNMSERGLVRWGISRVGIMFWSLGADEKANELFALLRERLTEPNLKLILEALGAAMTVHENRIGDALVVAERVLSTAHAPAAAFEFAAFAAGLGLPLAGRGGEFEGIAERFRTQLDANDSMIRVMLRYCDVLAVAMTGDLQLAEERVSYYTDSTAGGALLPWVIAKMMTGLLAIHRGRMSEAISSIESGLDAVDLEASVPWRLVGRLLLARGYAALGNAAESRRVLEDAKEHTGSFVAIHDPALAITKSWLAAAEGSSRHAVELARAAADAARASGQYAVEAQALHDSARFGDPTAGERLDELVHVVDGNVVAIQARHAAAVAACDAQRLTAVSAEFEHAGLLLSAADSAAQAASLYGRSGRRARSEEAGLRARALAAECGGARTPAILGVTGASD